MLFCDSAVRFHCNIKSSRQLGSSSHDPQLIYCCSEDVNRTLQQNQMMIKIMIKDELLTLIDTDDISDDASDNEAASVCVSFNQRGT